MGISMGAYFRIFLDFHQSRASPRFLAQWTILTLFQNLGLRTVLRNPRRNVTNARGTSKNDDRCASFGQYNTMHHLGVEKVENFKVLSRIVEEMPRRRILDTKMAFEALESLPCSCRREE